MAVQTMIQDLAGLVEQAELQMNMEQPCLVEAGQVLPAELE
jgi:hypothetical protein